MKFTPAKTLLALCLALAAGARAASERPFIHPGALVSQARLDFVRQRIEKIQKPWSGEFEALGRFYLVQRKPSGLRHCDSCGHDSYELWADAASVYVRALLWHYSGDEGYARGATDVLRSLEKFQSFNCGTDQDRLAAGWIGAVLGSGAELMRSYRGWDAEAQARLKAMIARAFFPQLDTMSTWNGNVDLTQAEALLALSVFYDDRPRFEAGLQRLRARVPAYIYKSPGPVPEINKAFGHTEPSWFTPAQWVDGLTQESCRDNGHHAQFGLAAALHACEIAHNQGVDLYGELEGYLLPAMELLAGQMLSGKVEACGGGKGTETRLNTFEVGYHHYAGRQGRDLPNTGKLIKEQIRPKGGQAILNVVYETLTHAGEDR